MEPTETRVAADPAHRPLLVFLHAGFVITGIVCTLLGPILPFLSARWSLVDAQAGSLFTAQFLGSMLGAVSSSEWIARRGYRFTLLTGFGLMAAGVGALAVVSWWLGLLSVFCYGLGVGLTIPATNMVIAEVNPARRASALSLVNLAWGIGAVACPAFVAVLQQARKPADLLLYALAAVLVAMTLYLAWASRSNFAGLPRQQRDPTPLPAGLFRGRVMYVLGALFFIYVGVENAVGGWVAAYAQRTDPASGTVWVLVPSFFWGMLLVGRGLAPAVLRHLAERKLILLGLMLAAAGVTGLLVATTLPGIIAGASLSGLGCAAVFPLLVSFLYHQLGALASRVAGPYFALGSLGGASLPWLVGFVSTRFGGLKFGLVVPLAASLVMMGLHLLNKPALSAGVAPVADTNS